MKKILLLFLLLPFFNSLLSQETNSRKSRDELKEYGLKRNSLDFYVAAGLHYTKDHVGLFSGHHKPINYLGGTAIRFSSNWYFNVEKKNRLYFRTNWIMGGVAIAPSEGFVIPIAPLNIGIGDNIQLSKDLNLDFSISGGLLVALVYPDPILKGIIYPEIKLQTKWLTIGLIYTRYVEHYTGLYRKVYHTLLLGLSKGF